jgi:peptidoglycan/xylan/chitin deacetylase (PgdA/CDA1 family)
MQGIVCLMYHELEVPGRPLCSPEPGYSRYVITAEEFRKQMETLAAMGLHGISVREMHVVPGNTIAISFDDGAESDLLFAAPILRELGHRATFFVSAGLLDQPGYLNSAQLRDLHEQGFEIGSHGSTHRYLGDLSAGELRQEVHGSKERIEAVLGTPIESFSCPGGRWNASVLASARAAGFKSFVTSEIGVNRPGQAIVRRVAIQRSTASSTFDKYVRGRLGAELVRARALNAAKGVLGNRLYDQLWRTLQAVRAR